MARHVREHLDRRGLTDVTTGVLDTMWPSRAPASTPWLATVRAAARDATGVEPVILPSLGGSLPQDAFGPLGVPCIWAAYANADQQQHAPNENLDLGCFREAIRTSATLFHRVADRGGQS